MDEIKNEIMNEAKNNLVNDAVVNEVTTKASNMNLALKVGLPVVVLATIAGLVWKGYDAHKAKKELHQPDKEIEVENEDVMEVTEAK